ncbi:MAG: methyltransferase domain-containing protein [Acidobacteria bacterium]|nr:methyltransferase domain-containing protein [Acidobacteriota bacterium]
MADIPDTEITYDEFPYPSMTIPDTHPDSMAAVARFHGLETAPPGKCRLLELGCGNGSNLNWIASTLPDSRFIGIDLSRNHIIEAEKTLSKLGLDNTIFDQRNVLEIDEHSYGTFDYIIAHGLFSWVPEVVADKILELFGKLLNPNGIGYISYNTLPGFHLRSILRGAMQFHTRNTSDPFKMAEDSRAFARFLSENSSDTSPYPQVLKYEYERMIYREDSNVYHDDLSAFNNPFYFSDFIDRARKQNLQFVSEAGALACLPHDLPADVLQVIANHSDSLIDSEQYVDLIKGTRFRKTLLCRSEIALDHEFKPDIVKRFFISSVLRPDSGVTETKKGKPGKFTTDGGSSFETDHMLTKAFLNCFETSKSHEIAFEELIGSAQDELDQAGFSVDAADEEIESTISILIQLYSNGLIRFHVCKSAAVNFIPEKPMVSDLSRIQARKGERIPTFQGANLVLSDEFTKALFDLLNGERTIAALNSELFEMFYDEKEGDKEAFAVNIAERLDEALGRMARVGLLC